MRKIIGYKLAIAVANEDKSVCDRVMDIVATDARWELSGGVICVSDFGEPNAMVTMIQALVMYEEVPAAATEDPHDREFAAQWERAQGIRDAVATPHDGGEAGRKFAAQFQRASEFPDALRSQDEKDMEQRILTHVWEFLVPGLCTRGPGHTGSCNGFWHEQCGRFKALP